jgi:hypothetical protein
MTQRQLIQGGADLVALGLHLPASRFTAVAQEATPVAESEALALVQGQHPSRAINGSFASPLVEIYGEAEIGQPSTVGGGFILHEGTIVPEGAIVTNQDQADALPSC